MITKSCIVCGSPFNTYPSHFERRKYCSYVCRNSVNSPHHGHNKEGQRSSTYQKWASMIYRTTNPDYKHTENYLGRGIGVCDRWLVFENFLSDMGECPKGLTLERRDNNKGYSPDNCYWATRKEQMRNTRQNRLLTFGNRTQCVIAWVEETGLSRGRLLTKARRGDSLLEVVDV